MLVVTLTGGIGSGKSAAAAHFARLGAPVIDADLVAREQVAPGMPALVEIAAQFGDRVVTADGTLDRARLRQLVFADADARHRLETILHPRIRAEMRQRLQRLDAPYAILVIPLLLETGQTDLGDRVLVIDVPETLQIERVCRRDHQQPDQVEAILRAQASRSRRLAAADDLIDNSGTREELARQAERLHRRYLQLADSH